VRLVCDDKLHLTDPAGQAPCAACGKPFCRVCFPAACPRCRQEN
jgi:Zn finger protein HypA/HybF involved in hydrogenase expression